MLRIKLESFPLCSIAFCIVPASVSRSISEMIQKTGTTPKPSSLPLVISHEGTTNRTGIQPALPKQPMLQPPFPQISALLAETHHTHAPGTNVNNL